MFCQLFKVKTLDYRRFLQKGEQVNKNTYIDEIHVYSSNKSCVCMCNNAYSRVIEKLIHWFFESLKTP